MSEGELTLCLTSEPGDVDVLELLSDSDIASSQEVSPTTIQPLPEACLTNPTGFTYGTREWTCHVVPVTATVICIVNGTPNVIGTAQLLLMDYSYVSSSLTTWAHQMQVRMISATGVATASEIIVGTFNAPGGYGFGCYSPCNLVNASVAPQPISVGATASFEAYYELSPVPGQRLTSSTWYNFAVRVPQGLTTWHGFDMPHVRCDAELSPAGCVFSFAIPNMWYSMTGSYSEFASHVQQAQASGLPGAERIRPLHRLRDPALIRANRAVACPAHYDRPPGNSCDEYPFASTYEGAALSQGGPRTFPGCSVSLADPPSTVANGYSVSMIDAIQNSGAGAAMNAQLYQRYRVLDGDPFTVEIRP